MKYLTRSFHKAFGFLAVAFGTLLLPSCSEEFLSDDQVDDGIEMVLNVGTDTRTTNDGDHTLWEEDDVLTVIHAPEDGNEYWASPFNKTGDNAFSGKVRRLSSSNDWYVVYPYKEENLAADQISLTFPASQTQTGNENMLHIAGEQFPLWGKVKGLPRGQTLNVQMQNLLAVAGFKVKNTTDDPVTVTQVQFTAPTSVSGTFTVDLTGDAPVLTAGTGATKVVTLNVESGEELAADATSWFYMAVTPFEASAGSKLKIKVTATDSEGKDVVFYQTKTLENATSFNSGSIKTVNVAYDTAHTTDPDAGSAGEVPLEPGEQPGDGVYLLVYENGNTSMAFAAFSEYKSSNYAIPVTVVDGVVIPSDDQHLSQFAMTIEVAKDANGNPIEHSNDAGHYAYNVLNSAGQYVFYSTKGGTLEPADALQIKDTNEMDIDGTTYKYYHTFVQAEDGVQILSSISGASGGNKYLLAYSSSNGFYYEENNSGQKLHLYLLGGSVKEKQNLYFDPDNVSYDFDALGEGLLPNKPTLKDAHTTVTSWGSDNTTVATVDENGNVTIHSAGSAVISATVASDDVYYGASASYTINSTSSKNRTFYLTTEFDASNEYIIVSNGKALTNNNGSIAATTVTDVNGEIQVANADAPAMLWTVTSTSNGKTLSNKVTGTTYYLRRASGSGSPSIVTTSPSGNYFYWAYNDNQLSTTSGTQYFLYYSGSAWAQTRTSSSASNIAVYSATKPLTPQSLSFAEDPVIKMWGDDCIEGSTFPVQTVSNAQTSVTYESSNSNVATISGTTITVVGKGSTTITATAKEENGFKKATATYSLHITDPAPAGFKHLGFFNLENDAVREYLDKAELEYTDDNITELSFVKTYYSKYYSSTNRTDIPKPVTISWDKASSGSAIIKIYLDKNNDLNLDSNEEVWTQTASSGSKSSYVYNLIPGKTYYCTVEDDSGNLLKGVFGTTGRRRMMRISDNSNAGSSANYGSNCRDLGGLKTTNGKRIKYGMIYRGTNLTSTSKEERAFMVNYMNIGLDNDLRSGTGGGSSRDDPFHSTSSGHVDYGEEVVYCGPGYSGTSDLQQASKFKQTMKAFIDCAIRGKASYFHCYIGSDRTGYTGLMIEGLLGVTANDCSIDYEMTTFASNITGDRTRNGSKGGDSMYYFGSARTFLDGLSYNKQGNLTLQQKVINYLLEELDITQEQIDAFFEAVLEDDPDL